MLLTPQPDTRSARSVAARGKRTIRAAAAAERDISILRVQRTGYVATRADKSIRAEAQAEHVGSTETGAAVGRKMLYTQPPYILLGSMRRTAPLSCTEWRS